jgi:hypothetical protein
VRWLVASLAVGLSAGLITSIAYAAIPATGGLISGCVSKEGFKGQHLVTLLDTAQSAVCQTGQTLISWNQTGPQVLSAPRVIRGSRVLRVLSDPKDLEATSSGAPGSTSSIDTSIYAGKA